MRSRTHMASLVTALGLAIALAGAGLLWQGGMRLKEASAIRAAEEKPRDGMAIAVEAVGEVAARVKAGDLEGGREAYQSFLGVYGQVLGPISLENAEAAQRMALANDRLEVMMAGPKPSVAAVSRECDTILRSLHTAAEAMGISLVARASGTAGDVAAAPDRVIPVTAREYRFEPARIDVRKGERVTIRFTNGGTEKHEFELDAFGFEIKPIPPGTTVEKSFVADKAGMFQYACHVDGHAEKGMIGFLVVR